MVHRGGDPTGTGCLEEEVEVRGGATGRLREGVVYKRDCFHCRNHWEELDRLVAQSKVIWFPVSSATEEEQGSGKLRNKLFSRNSHATSGPTKETVAHQLRQIRPLRFPRP